MTRSIARLVATLMLLACGIAAAGAVARPYIVIDMDSGRVLADRNANQFWYGASVTKLMTAYVTFKAMRSGRASAATEIVVSQNALNQAPSKMGFKVGTVITLDNALKMMLVHSSNDIAMAVGETIGGGETGFVAMMNAEAARLGMTSTHYVNPNGLPGAGQETTARDLAVLTMALWKDFPEQRPLFAIPAIRFGDRLMRSANTLLERYHGTVGMKTGFICSSGFNIVATATRSGHTLAAVVLGADNARDRAELTARLLNQGFDAVASSGPRPQLASFRAASPVPEPIDMRDQICTRRKVPDADDTDDDAPGGPLSSALEPRFQLMDPVDVKVVGLRTPDGSVNRAVTEADVVPPPPPPRGKKARKGRKPAAIAKSAAAKTQPAAADDADGTPAAKTPAAKPAADKPSADKPSTDKSSADKPPTGKAATPKTPAKPPKKKPKLEIGVPFDSSDIAPATPKSE